MINKPMLLDLHDIFIDFRTKMTEVLRRERLYHPMDVVIEDFFQIVIARTSDCVAFFDDAGTQKAHLHPIGIHRVMVSTHMQDIFFDEFSGYVFECSYFDVAAIESRFVHHQIGKLCVDAVGEILKTVMNLVIQTNDGQVFFHPDNATVDMAMTDLIIDPVPNRLDVKVTVRFE